MDPADLQRLAAYRDPDDERLRGINVLRGTSEPRLCRLQAGSTAFRVFGRIQRIDDVPAASEVLAELFDASGDHYSYVLWFPDERAVVVPFDPNEAVESYWHEDYVPSAHRTALPKPLLALYYAVKPLMPRALKRRLRRSMAQRALASPDSLAWPADESLDLLQRFLLRVIMLAAGRAEVEFAWFWPDAHPWAVALTHDVETAAGLARVPYVVELERARGLRSSFNMVPRDYDVPDALVRQLDRDGFEVGVHGYTHDGLLFSSRAVFDERAITIRDAARRWGAAGFRSPATYRNREWLPLLGFEYDSSYSNTAPCEPQPGGCGSFFPFPLGDMVELPITLPQDHTLFELFEQTGPDTWLTVLDRVKRANGMACVLAHPDPAAGYIGVPENEASYVALLDEVVASEAWTPLPRDLARWWRKRDAAPWPDVSRVEGASCGRAVLDAAGAIEIVPPVRVAP
jgi:peptidoglycan/xylan/chitin deacetylase (PgdA/CDA1 family)